MYFSKYAFVVPLKDKKGTTVVNACQSILDSSKRRPNKIWVNQDSEFYNNHFKKRLKDNNIEMYSTHNEGKSVVAERFIRTLKNKFSSLNVTGLYGYVMILVPIIEPFQMTKCTIFTDI